MSVIPFAERLKAQQLDRMPEADRPELEKMVQYAEEAAERIRVAFSYLEEPSNVFRLAPATKAKQP